MLSVAVIGNDTVLAALPAHPVQLAHGCHLLGYHTVVPASWGDELVADAVLHTAEQRGRRPAIVCACDLARARLTTGAGGLQPFLISTISPPVAAARHLRTLLSGKQLDITFVGDCASGADPVFDARYSPDVFLVRLRSAGIDLKELPTHFDNLVPPDRRRHASLPGGCPTADALARCCPDRELIELTGEDLAAELAQQLLGHGAVLLDVAPGVGCACTGARRSASPRTARVAVMSLEPPRSPQPIIEGGPFADLSSWSSPPKLSLLPRDPDADLVQSVLPESTREEPESLSDDATAALDAHAGDDSTPAGRRPPELPGPWRPPVATTPSRALQAVRPGRNTPPPHATPHHLPPSPPRVPEPVIAVTEGSTLPEAEPIGTLLSEVAVPLPVLTEPPAPQPDDPVAMMRRRAQARIHAHGHPKAPPPRRDLFRQVLLWTAIVIAAGLLALAIVARTR